VVVTAEYDPLRDEGEAYAERWPRRVRTEVGRFDGLIHGFFTLGPVSEAAQTAIDESLELFAKLLAGG
jgi:acetyl esterase